MPYPSSPRVSSFTLTRGARSLPTDSFSRDRVHNSPSASPAVSNGQRRGTSLSESTLSEAALLEATLSEAHGQPHFCRAIRGGPELVRRADRRPAGISQWTSAQPGSIWAVHIPSSTCMLTAFCSTALLTPPSYPPCRSSTAATPAAPSSPPPEPAARCRHAGLGSGDTPPFPSPPPPPAARRRDVVTACASSTPLSMSSVAYEHRMRASRVSTAVVKTRAALPSTLSRHVSGDSTPLLPRRTLSAICGSFTAAAVTPRLDSCRAASSPSGGEPKNR
eukprot:335867-Chlamydomonas_euryale.AAC.5